MALLKLQKNKKYYTLLATPDRLIILRRGQAKYLKTGTTNNLVPLKTRYTLNLSN